MPRARLPAGGWCAVAIPRHVRQGRALHHHVQHRGYLRAGVCHQAPATVDLENLAGDAAKIVYVSGNGQAVPVGAAFADLKVQVLDAHDNPVADDAAAQVGFVSVANGSNAAAAVVDASVSSTAGGFASSSAQANATAGS